MIRTLHPAAEAIALQIIEHYGHSDALEVAGDILGEEIIDGEPEAYEFMRDVIIALTRMKASATH